MARRGRRPHPDILTPRQWEVLDLLREGLSDQQIAERLRITLDGAKYHVSEILSKLSVSSRDEAAAWRLAERTRAGRLAWGAFAVALVGSASAVVAVLAIGALRSGTGEGESATATVGAGVAFADLDLPEPEVTPVLTADQALMLNRNAIVGHLRAVTIDVTTQGAVYDLLFPGLEPANPLTKEERSQTAWVFRFATIANACAVGCEPGGTEGAETCRLGWAYIVEDDSPERYRNDGLSTFGEELPGAACEPTAVDRSLAVVLAARVGLSGERPVFQIEVAAGTYADSSRWVGEIEVVDSSVTPDTPVWQVHLSNVWGIGPIPSFYATQSIPRPTCDVYVLLRQDAIRTAAIGGYGYPC